MNFCAWINWSDLYVVVLVVGVFETWFPGSRIAELVQYQTVADVRTLAALCCMFC